MSMVQIFNKALSDSINKTDAFYEAWVGADPFTPEVTIVDSEDYNCGAVCNELEFARTVTQYIVSSLAIDNADDEELNALINGFIDLPRRGVVEADLLFRNRFRFLVVEQANPSRTTRWAILDAIRYFVSDASLVQLIEPWDTDNCYFQIRLEGAALLPEDTLFLDDPMTGYLDQYYIGGASLGTLVNYLEELVSRVKAAGVDFDILFIEQDRVTLDSNAFIGTIQRYIDSSAMISITVSFTKTADTVIV